MSDIKSIVHVWQGTYPWEVRVGKLNRSIQATGSKVAVVARAMHGQSPLEVIDGVTIYRVGANLPRLCSLPIPANMLWENAIARAVKDSAAQIIIVRDIPLVIPAVRASRTLGVKVVLDMAEHYPAAMRSWKKYSENPILRFLVHTAKLPDLVERKSIHAADGILVVCDEMKSRWINMGVESDAIAVVRNTPELPLELADAAPRNPWDAGVFVFGYHGILCADRRLDAVLDGFALAHADESGLRLLLAGGGEVETELRSRADHLGITSAVTFTGRYSPDRLPQLYADADAGIVSLEDNEFTRHTLANKFFDYAARSKPFIFSDLPPLRHIMNDMNCGVPFVPENSRSVAEAMLKTARLARENLSEYRSMGERGARSVSSKYNWGKDGNRAIALLSSMMHSAV